MEKLLTPDEVSEVLGIPKPTLYSARTRGGDYPPALKIGRHLRYRRSDIEAYLERLAAAPTK